MKCAQAGCDGQIVDGFCDLCGIQAPTRDASSPSQSTQPSQGVSQRTGSTQLSGKTQRGSRRQSTSSRLSSTRRLGLGLVQIPEIAKPDPLLTLMAEAKVPENKRFCTGVKANGVACETPLTREKCTKCGHATELVGAPRTKCSKCGGPCEVVAREKGFCNVCGTPYDFRPKLQAGDVIGGQYQTCGCVAFGGMGWLYLAKDTTLDRYVLLKGLINTSDPSLARAAIAERQFLAAVKHANIVGVYTCVSDTREIDGKAQTHAYTVMEYISGKTLKQLRKERGPLPVAEALAYMHPVLEAFGYMHAQGLIYNDFKPDNVMIEGGEIKVIDLGGVCRATQADGDIYSTIGYAAPELSDGGPSFASDLYSIGRTLAVLVTEFKGYQSQHKHTLRAVDDEPLFAKHPSLYKFLHKACHENPNMRFQSADEMAEQLVGLMREIVSVETGTPHPAESRLFGPDTLGFRHLDDMTGADVLDIQSLPPLKLDASDPATAFIQANPRGTPVWQKMIVAQAIARFPKSIEAHLAMANTQLQLGDYVEVEKSLAEVEALDAYDWRVIWYRGLVLVAQGDFARALEAFDTCYGEVPGELVPKLAIAIAAEKTGDATRAIYYYDVVSRTNPDYATAAFGLARCLARADRRDDAVAALRRIAQTSNLYTNAQKSIATAFLRGQPGVTELGSAAQTIEALLLEGVDKFRMLRDVLSAALARLDGGLAEDVSTTLLSYPLQQRQIRLGLENAYRNLARLEVDVARKTELVDLANQVRPKTWV